MSALGQKQTYAVQQSMSALPPIATAKADMAEISNTVTRRAVTVLSGPWPCTITGKLKH
jgi:hypothetical protein